MFAYDMRKVSDSVGGGKVGVKAIFDTFRLDIVEIIFISELYSKDTKIIEHLEDYYMVTEKTLVPEGYNIASGIAGPHVSEFRSGHARARLHAKLDAIIAQGFTIAKIANYLKLSYTKIQQEVNIAHEGASFSDIQKEFITNRIFSIVGEGYFTIVELSQFFKGFNPTDVYHSLRKTNKGKDYLKGLISSTFATLKSEGSQITYKKVADRLGIKTSWQSIGEFIRDEMGGITNLINNYKVYLKHIAKRMIKFSSNAHDLLTKLGWLDGINDETISGRISNMVIATRLRYLFGKTSFYNAKMNVLYHFTD